MRKDHGRSVGYHKIKNEIPGMGTMTLLGESTASCTADYAADVYKSLHVHLQTEHMPI